MRPSPFQLTAAVLALALVGCDREALQPPAPELEASEPELAQSSEESGDTKLSEAPVSDSAQPPVPEPTADPPQPTPAGPAAPSDPPPAPPGASPSEPAEPAGPPDRPTVEPSQSQSPSTYIVRRGDTLSTIAADQLGDGNRWLELYETNRGVIGDDPNGIRSGMELVLP